MRSVFEGKRYDEMDGCHARCAHRENIINVRTVSIERHQRAAPKPANTSKSSSSLTIQSINPCHATAARANLLFLLVVSCSPPFHDMSAPLLSMSSTTTTTAARRMGAKQSSINH